jgi:hypothetical protein
MRWTDTMMDDHIYLSDWGIYRLANHLTDALGQPMTITHGVPPSAPSPDFTCSETWKPETHE